MNGIEKITARIEQETQSEIDRVLEDARKKAGEIAAKYQIQADSERNELAARNEKNAVEREERLVSVAQMESRKVILAAKQEMVEKAYQRAEEKLRNLSDRDYVEVLTQLLVHASSTKKEEVVFSSKDAGKVGVKAVQKANELLKDGALTVSRENRDISGGFILKNGKIEVNCTFDTLVRLQKAETAGAVVNKLFPEA